MNLSTGHEQWLERAERLLLRRHLREALAAFRCAEALGADADRCAAGRWQTFMLLGDLEQAWCESDAIRRRGAPDPHRFWNGEDLDGKRVIVRCLHGFGDSVQFLRYAPVLREQAFRLIFEVPPELRELAAAFDGVDEVISWGPEAPSIPPEWDVQVEVTELPYLLRTQADDLPLATGYLRVSEGMRATAELRPLDQSKLHLGVVWAGGAWNRSRSVPFAALSSVLASHRCEFWNLQGGDARSEWNSLGQQSHLHSAEECAASLARLASLIAQLDLVITCDTLAAHLAGAIGTPAWVMLEYTADWRWQDSRADSPWYPSLRLFRQAAPGDWSSVVAEVRSCLERLELVKRAR